MVIERNIKSAYTLIELVVTITLTVIIFSILSLFISKPIQIYSNIVRKANLLDIADSTVRRISRELQQALPNSIRVRSENGKWAVEMIPILGGCRYKAEGPGTDTNILSFDAEDTDFDVLPEFPNKLLGNNGYRAVIYNLGDYGTSSDDPTAGVNVYSPDVAVGPIPPAGTHVITSSDTVVTLSNDGSNGHVSLNPAFKFAFSSPQQRLYFVQYPLSYICDPTAKTITRFTNYDIDRVQPIDPTISPLSLAKSDLLADHITACSFQYKPGAFRRNGIVTISITVSDGIEEVNLLEQIQVSNMP